MEVREARETLDALQRRHDATLAELDAVKGSVRVFCRLRPLHSNEAGAPTTKPLLNATTDGGACRQVVVSPANATSRSFEFDRVFEPTASSSDVYDELRPLTRKVATGCSATILAYGQTGSGKTYTVNALHASVVDELLAVHKEEEGGAAVAKGGARLAVCMEIYLDHVRDLGAEVNLGGGKADAAAIAPSAGMTSASAGGGVQNNEINLTWHHVTDASEAAARVSAATERRVTANNGINAHSSRSHLVVVYALLASDGERGGQLALVDLAGSERLTRTEATGERAKEAVAINKSLSGELATLRTRRAPLTSYPPQTSPATYPHVSTHLTPRRFCPLPPPPALGDVLHSLIGKSEHVPYRNSKLTTLLQPCLRRGCRVALIVAASPSSADAAETVHTLGFGVRARSCALGPIATATGKAGKGGMAAGAAGAAGGELGRVQKQLVESRSAAAAAEKAAAVLRQQATAAEEAQRAAAAAAKRADGRIKELEAALERREAQSASERLRSEKLQSELQRKLEVALRGRRNGPVTNGVGGVGAAASATAVPAQLPAAAAVSAPVTRSASPKTARALVKETEEPMLAGPSQDTSASLDDDDEEVQQQLEEEEEAAVNRDGVEEDKEEEGAPRLRSAARPLVPRCPQRFRSSSCRRAWAWRKTQRTARPPAPMEWPRSARAADSLWTQSLRGKTRAGCYSRASRLPIASPLAPLRR